jgi:hypothetical protein
VISGKPAPAEAIVHPAEEKYVNVIEHYSQEPKCAQIPLAATSRVIGALCPKIN